MQSATSFRAVTKGGQVSIISHAFGRVQLTGADAIKFKNQVTYGRPKAAAKAGAVAGAALSEALSKDGVVRITLKKR